VKAKNVFAKSLHWLVQSRWTSLQQPWKQLSLKQVQFCSIKNSMQHL